MTTKLAKTEKETQNLPVIMANSKLDEAMRLATELSKSDMIPKEYQNKPANCLIAVELSYRLKTLPLLIMQNMDPIYGRPSFRSSFIIACINNSGKIIGSLKFEMDEKETKCRAWAVEKETGTKLVGPKITLEMAQAEGWMTKNGSKWKTMPGLMLRYRAAAFFGRLYCPEIMNGMYSVEEMEDMHNAQDVQAEVVDPFATPEIPEPPKAIVTQAEEMEISEDMEKMANEYFEANEQ